MFGTIKGFQQVKDYLIHTIAQAQVPHAQLFIAPEGAPALALTIAFVAYLYCTDRTAQDACGACTACQKIQKHIHPDLHYIFPIGRTTKLKGKKATPVHFLPTWRNFLANNLYGNLQDWADHIGNESKNIKINKEQVKQIHQIITKKPFESSYKTILVWLPEQLNLVAANTLLKMVEEPTPNTFFLFITQNLYQVLPTLQSRTWPIHIRPFTDEEILANLAQQHADENTKKLMEVTTIAQGNLNLAQKLITEETNNYFDDFAQWMRAAYVHKLSLLVELSEKFHKHTPQVQKTWILYAISLLRHTLLTQLSPQQTNPVLSEKEFTFCQKLGNAISTGQLNEIIGQLTDLQKVLSRNAAAKLAFIHMSLAIQAILKSKISKSQ